MSTIERRVSDDGYLVRLTIGNEFGFNLPAIQVVQNLIRDNRVLAHGGLSSAKFSHREIADPDIFHQAPIDQRLHRTHRVLNWNERIRPVNLIQIDMSDVEAAQAGIGGLQHIVMVQMAARNLRCNKYLVADPLDGFSDYLFRSISFCGVNQSCAQLDRRE